MTNEKMLIEYDAVYQYAFRGVHGGGLEDEDFNAIINAIDAVPTVDAVEVVHGRWIHCKGKSNLWYCSVCGEKILYNPTRRTYNIEKRAVHEVNKYCRGCGAMMDGGNEDV